MKTQANLKVQLKKITAEIQITEIEGHFVVEDLSRRPMEVYAICQFDENGSRGLKVYRAGDNRLIFKDANGTEWVDHEMLSGDVLDALHEELQNQV